MLRVCAALSVALLVPEMAAAKELKPKFGDIDGVYYTDVAENREACRQAVQRKIYLCSQNTSFASNTEDRRYQGCLPIFRRQAQGCADHFRSEAYKCRGSGPVRIADFTGFACTVTATVVEEGGEPERSEPGGGTGSREPVQQGRDPAAQQSRRPAVQLSPKCVGMQKGAKCWLELANMRGCHIFSRYYIPGNPLTWSGACAGGVAVGRGTLRSDRYKATMEGAYVGGQPQGRWITRWASGGTAEATYVDGKRHGKWVVRNSLGGCDAWDFDHGRKIRGPYSC